MASKYKLSSSNKTSCVRIIIIKEIIVQTLIHNPNEILNSFSRNQSRSSCRELKSLSLNSIALADNADYYFKVYESEKFARDAFERLNNRTRRETKLPSYKVFHNKNTIFYYDDVYEELPIPQIKEVVDLGKKYTGVKD